MSIFFLNNLDTKQSIELSLEESIATLVMLGWERKLPNLFFKPSNFKLPNSIGILDDGRFIFLEDKTGKIFADDEIRYTLDGPCILTYSPSTIIQVVMDNTNDT